MTMNSKPRLIQVNIEGEMFYRLIDSEDEVLKKGRIRRLLERYKSYFYDYDKLLMDKDITYVHLLELIEKLNRGLFKIGVGEIEVEQSVLNYIEKNKYAIHEQQIAGRTIKAMDSRWKSELEEFHKIVNHEITRPLKGKQLQASFYLATMKRAANFSVPGSGKTAMLYGAFAYLSSHAINQVKK